MKTLTRLWIAMWLVLAFAFQAGAVEVCYNVKTGAMRVPVKVPCRRNEQPFNLSGGTHWSTTQNVAATGDAASPNAAGLGNLGALCANSDIPVGIETPIAEASSVNSVDSNPFDVVLSGQLLLKNPNQVCIMMHVAAYVGTPSGCDSFATCAPQMTRLTGIYDNMVCGGLETSVPFTLNQVALPATDTAMEYLTVTVDFNGFNGGSDGECVSTSGYSDEHDHIQ